MFVVTASKLNNIRYFSFETEGEANSAINAMPEAGWTFIALTERID